MTRFELERDGAQHLTNAFDVKNWSGLVAEMPEPKAGVRLFGDNELKNLLNIESEIQNVAREYLGENAQPVRAIYFNKTAENNWPLGWHQDRTIAVKERFEIEGFGPWSIKAGLHHVEPPFEVISQMVTLRLHLDKVDETNAPLRFAPGSHRMGKLKVSNYQGTLDACGEAVSLAEAGDIWVYRTSILHASDAAAKPKQRRVIQIDYSAAELPSLLEWAGI